MKSVKIYMAGIILLLTVGVLVSCTKSFDEKTVQQTNFSNSTLTQVFIAMVGASRNYVYVDGIQVTGAALSSGSVFPSTGHAFTVAPGLRAFLIRDTLPATTQVPLSFAENMQVGKYQTIFVYDTITSPKQKTVNTNIVIPTDSTTRLRFANFIYNPTDVPGIDIFSFLRNANVATNLKVTDVTDFIPYSSGITDTLYIRENGSATTIVKVTLSLTQKRSYTLVYRGSHRGTRTATLFANR